MFSEAASTFAQQVDHAFLFIVAVCAAMLALITVLMVVFVIRYRRKVHPVAAQIPGNTLLEIVWTVIPTLLVLAMFYYGWVGYRDMEYAPGDAMTIQVTGRMWSWSFLYPNGKRSDRLVVPLDKKIKLELTSEDVLHSFYIPAFRLKKDTVPGMKSLLWFQPDEVGTFDIFCAEYCGVGHAAMLSKVRVLPEEEFAAWLGEGRAEAAEQPRADLLTVKGCTGCHSLDGSRIVGPSFQGLFGRRHVVITGGEEREIVIDEAYLRRSLLEPNADVVKGYPAIMPSQQGKLTEEEIEEIIETLKNVN